MVAGVVPPWRSDGHSLVVRTKCEVARIFGRSFEAVFRPSGSSPRSSALSWLSRRLRASCTLGECSKDLPKIRVGLHLVRILWVQKDLGPQNDLPRHHS